MSEFDPPDDKLGRVLDRLLSRTLLPPQVS